MKKSQVSLFMLLAIAFVTAGMLFLWQYNTQQSGNKNTITQFDLRAVEGSINSCIKETAHIGIIRLALLGGTTQLVEPAFHYENFTTNYLFDENRSFYPTIEGMQEELARYINLNIINCTAAVEGIVSSGRPKTTIILSEDAAIFFVTWPLKIKEGNRLHQISEFSASFPGLKLARLQNATAEIIRKTEQNPRLLDIIFLVDQDLDIKVMPYNTTLIYLVKDPESMLDGEPYFIMFATKVI